MVTLSILGRAGLEAYLDLRLTFKN